MELLASQEESDMESCTTPKEGEHQVFDVFASWVQKTAKQTVPCSIDDRPELKEVQYKIVLNKPGNYLLSNSFLCVYTPRSPGQALLAWNSVYVLDVSPTYSSLLPLVFDKMHTINLFPMNFREL